jgi:hypothetical protein
MINAMRLLCFEFGEEQLVLLNVVALVSFERFSLRFSTAK